MNGLGVKLKNRRVTVFEVDGGWHIQTKSLHIDAPKGSVVCRTKERARGNLLISEMDVSYSDEALAAIYHMIKVLKDGE